MRRRPPRSTLFSYTTLFRSTVLSGQFARQGLQFFKVNKSVTHVAIARPRYLDLDAVSVADSVKRRSEEHTSELQSHSDLVCRLLLEKKKEVTKCEGRYHKDN